MQFMVRIQGVIERIEMANQHAPRTHDLISFFIFSSPSKTVAKYQWQTDAEKITS
jgi:hypothetical protein